MRSTSTVNSQSQVHLSFVISGSTVAVVGMILMITSTLAFIGMAAFGVAVALAGVVMAKRTKTDGKKPVTMAPGDD